MTPLIREMVALTPEPEKATWFDLGSLTRFKNASPIQVPAESMMRLPFDLTAIAAIDKDGVKFALWLLNNGNGNSITVGGCTEGGKYFHPFTYANTTDGIRFYEGDTEMTDSNVKSVFKMVAACLLGLHDCTEAHQPTVKANSLTNQRRIAKGKLPLVYDWHTVKLEPSSPPSESQGGTHATPRRHQCRGHWRTCKSGKRVWVKDCWRGDASKGTVFKDYEVTK